MTAIFEQVREQLRDVEIEWATPDDNRLDAILSPDVLLDAVQVLKDMGVFSLSAITGLDMGTDENLFEILYHFCARSEIVTLRIQTDRTQPGVDSICSVFPYASLLERETAELFGISFDNSPDTSHLFLPDDWDDRIYPLRKDAILEEVDDVNN